MMKYRKQINVVISLVTLCSFLVVGCGNKPAGESEKMKNAILENKSIITSNDLEGLNDSGAPFSMECDEAGRMTSLDGAFTELVLTNQNDAWQLVENMSELLGISDVFSEMDFSNISDTNYTCYYFVQSIDGIPVYGRGISLTAENGHLIALRSNYLPVGAGEKCEISRAAAKKAAKEYMEGGKIVGNIGEVIYSFREYEDNPVRAYTVQIDNGMKTTVFIDGMTGVAITDIPE